LGVLVKTKIINSYNWKHHRLSIPPPFLEAATKLSELYLISYDNLHTIGGHFREEILLFVYLFCQENITIMLH